MQVSNPHHPLSFIIAGFEHSGTTLVSEILRQHPELESGFEGGLLLPKKIKGFEKHEPFASNFKSGWKVTDEQFSDICSADSYAAAYSKIREYSEIIQNKDCHLFDKTPRYLQKLSSVMRKVDDIKAVVLVRDMRSIMDSTFSRSDLNIDDWIRDVYPITKRHTMSYLDGLTLANNDKRLNPSIMVMRYEELILDQENQCENLFEFLGYDFSRQYLDFKNVRYGNVYGKNIQPDFIKKYEKNLPKDFLDMVVDDFELYSKYFWS